jgi:hypothetical protein
MMPFSYTGFGTVAILLMIVLAAAGQVLQYIKNNRSKHRQGGV